MTNYEFYKENMEKIEKKYSIAIKNNKPVPCKGVMCSECQRNTKRACSVIEFMEWAMAEYELTDEMKKDRLNCGEDADCNECSCQIGTDDCIYNHITTGADYIKKMNNNQLAIYLHSWQTENMSVEEIKDLLNSEHTLKDVSVEQSKKKRKPKINLPDDIAVDTPILVSEDGKHWHKSHFARYSNANIAVIVWAYGHTSFTDNGEENLMYYYYAKLPEEGQKDE